MKRLKPGTKVWITDGGKLQRATVRSNAESGEYPKYRWVRYQRVGYFVSMRNIFTEKSKALERIAWMATDELNKAEAKYKKAWSAYERQLREESKAKK